MRAAVAVMSAGYSHAAFRDPASLRSVPGNLALRQRHAGGRRATHDLLGAERQSRGRAGRVPAWRPGRRLGAGASPLLRSAILPHRGVRPARLRPLHAARRAARQHHRPSRGRHGEAAGPISASTQWLLFGGSWGSTLALAYGLKHPERVTGFILRGIFLGARTEIDWFLHGMRAIFPEAWRDFAEHLPAGRARRPPGQLLSPPDRPQSRPPSPGGARLEPLRGGLLDALSDGARALRIGPWRLRAGAVAHRGALLRQRHVRARGLAVGGSRPHPPSALHHRAGPLRHRLPAGDRRRAGAGLAGGALRRRAGRRPQRARAGHPRGAGQRHRKLHGCRAATSTCSRRAFPGRREHMSFELPPEQTGAAAWYGPEMAKRDDWLMPLSAAEIAEVESAATALARREADIAAITPADFPLPTLGAQAQGARARRSAERPRLPAAARPAGRALVDARSGDGVLRPGRPSRQRALAERQGPCAGPRAGSRPRRARSQRAHLPDQRAPDLSHRFLRHRRACCASRRRSPAACRRW